MEWSILVTYRETIQETLPLDEEALVLGLQSLGSTPTHAETDGRKLRVHFEKADCMENYQVLQRALAGVLPEKGDPNSEKIDFFLKEVHAKQGWRQLLAMMRNYPNTSKYVQ
jgi:hypothetical protein